MREREAVQQVPRRGGRGDGLIRSDPSGRHHWASFNEITSVDDEDADDLYKQAVYRPVKIYRVWNKAKPYTQLGRWWSFSVPKGPVDDYRKNNAICLEWSQRRASVVWIGYYSAAPTTSFSAASSTIPVKNATTFPSRPITTRLGSFSTPYCIEARFPTSTTIG